MSTRDDHESRGRQQTHRLFGEHTLPLGTLLFASLGAPVSWSLHFGLVYLLDSMSCAAAWQGAETAIYIATAPLAALSAYSGIVSWRAWRELRGERPDDAVIADVHIGREATLIAMGMMAAVFFTLLIVMEGLAPAFVPTCLEARPS